MKTHISTQLMQIALSWLIGLASGFLYDAFKVLRRESGAKALSAFLDALFCLIVCFALFTAGMSAGEGRVGLTIPVFALTGFACYMCLLSDTVFSTLRRVFRKLKACIGKVVSPIGKIIRALKKRLRSTFSKSAKWLKTESAAGKCRIRKRKAGGKADGAEKNKHDSGYCDYGDDSLWHIQSDKHS